jgi:hypothetical protein
MMGWDIGTQNIIEFTNNDGREINLISEYGQINESTLRTACEVFMSGVNANSRAAQNNEQMWRCIYNTLTKEAKAKLLTYLDDFKMPNASGKMTEVGPLMYKTMMRLATLDNNATVQALRANLRELPQYSIKVNGNIDQIHEYFDQNYNQLKSRGHGVDDVMTILFEAYKVIPDSNFNAYITRLFDDWIDQSADMIGATHVTLMKKAKQRFDLLNKNNTWGAQSPQDEKIVALESQLKDLKLSAQLLKKLQQRDKNKNQKGQDKANDGSKDQQGEDNPSDKDDWEWIPPEDKEPKVKQVGKKTWHWCPHHEKWTIHKPENCKLGKMQAADSDDNQANQTNYSSTLAQIALLAADE